MHRMINTMYEKRMQLDELLGQILSDKKYESLVNEVNIMSVRMKKWDEEMVQRKSKAYDDVENFPNKFTANYLFMLNHNESDIPRVNQPTLDRLNELTPIWKNLETQGNQILEKDLPALNSKLWSAGLGAIWKK
jgi:hypothetical protein